MKIGDIVQHRITEEYGTVHESPAGYEVRVWSEEREKIDQTLRYKSTIIEQYWKVINLPKGYEVLPNGGIKKIKEMENEKEFENFFKKKLEEDKEYLQHTPYSKEELKRIYREEYEHQKSAPPLELEFESQKLNSLLYQYYLPERWEMYNGKLLCNDEELLKVLKLIIYNVGVEKTLQIIPMKLIEKYIKKKNKKE